MLVKRHMKEINQARDTLKRLERFTEEDTYGAGRFAEACRDAEEALTNVLLTAKFFMDNRDVTDEVLKGAK